MFDKAVQDYNKAIELNTDDAEAWYNKGHSLSSLGSTTEANIAFAKAKGPAYD